MNPQTPPAFQPEKKHPLLKTIGIAALVAACFGAGVLGGRLAAPSAGSSVSLIAGTHTNQDEIILADVSNVVDRIKPTVVEISVEVVSSNPFFGQQVGQGAGSGVIMSSDGYIITNDHVVDGASAISIKLYDGTEYPAKLVGTDPQTDLAVIKVDAKDLTPAVFGNSNDLKVGDIAIAIGNPLGSLGGTVTTGIISALDRQIEFEDKTMTLLQTDAAINPGNSGGGLFDAEGNLIGIVNAKQSALGIEGLGFAIPISDAVDILQELIENGAVTSRPVLGVSLQETAQGIYIVQVQQGSAAAKAGLERGDRILTFNGEQVQTVAQLKNMLSRLKAGDEVSMTVNRDGKERNVKIILQSQH